ncbi:MAG: hypothetical protein IKU20_06820 [Lachnospiraceae bacterium]|nr:hypothetical protein [Lachnospiraceae bacterium]
MIKKKRFCSTGLVCAVMITMLSGCSVVETLTPVSKEEKEYGKPETMVILSTERLRYEDVYTEELWSAAVDESGTSFGTVLLSQVHDFLIELKTMSNMAKEQDMELSSREKDLVKEASKQYMEALGSAHAAEFELTEEQVNTLYSDYRTAEKLVEQLTGSMNLEVSDSEAKVIEIAQIKMASAEIAAEVFKKVSEDGSDFYAIAKEYSESEEIKKQLTHGLESEAYEEAAFLLETGEISEVIIDSGNYYILKCINDYDVEATKLHKEEMIQEKKNEAFHTSYQMYKSEHPLVEDSTFWSSMSMDACPLVEADFFEIYETVFMGDFETQ